MASATTGAGSILAPDAAPMRATRPPAAAPYATVDSSPPRAAGARRPNFQFDLSDIEKAHSISYVSRLHQAEPRCPLDPVYRLARVEERPLTPPRFVRDSMDVRDIERAQSKPLHGAAPPRVSTSLSVDDMGPGARPLARYPPRRVGSAGASLDTRDITHTRFVSQRCTDPLDPVYSFGRSSSLDVSSLVGALHRSAGLGSQEEKEAQGDVVQFGPIPGAKSRTLPPQRQAANIMSLRTDDISSPLAQSWSWAKPPRTQFRETTKTSDVPGAQTGADRGRMAKTMRHTNPNERNYDTLGGERVSDRAGMVHVHRHVLDGSPYAASWRPSQGEPAPDAAGVSMWRSGNFTAGMLAPKGQPAAAPAAAAAPIKQEFGAPAEDTFFRDTAAAAAKPAPASRKPSMHTAPAASAAEPVPASTAIEDSVPAASSPAAASVSHAAAPNLSYPIDSRKAPTQQKRHKDGATATSNILAHPPSNAKETQPADPAKSRVAPMTFGVRGPFAVPTTRASIEETQQAYTVSAASIAAGSRPNSRPLSRTQGQPGALRPTSAAEARALAAQAQAQALPTGYGSERRSQLLAAMSPTATTLSNAFSLAFVPSSTGTALPRTLPYSSPVARPGLGTVELFERGGSTLQSSKVAPRSHHLEQLARTQEKKMATMRAEEMRQVRMLA